MSRTAFGKSKLWTYKLIDIKETDFPAISAVILTKNDIEWVKKIESLCFELPIIVVIEEGNEEAKTNFYKNKYSVVVDTSKKNIELYSRKIENLTILWQWTDWGKYYGDFWKN